MSAELQELLLTPPAEFLKMLKDLIAELDSLHRSISPTLRRRIDDHSGGELDDIIAFIGDVEVQLTTLSLLRHASGLMVTQFSETEMDELDGLLNILMMFQEEMRKAVEWLFGVLDKCAEDSSEEEAEEISEEE